MRAGSLEYYTSFDEKRDFLYQIKIDTKSDFDSFIDTNKVYITQNNNTVFFRGVNESKFKLYNSAQKFWITRDMKRWGMDYLTFIRTLIKNARRWNKNLLDRYFQAFGLKKAYDIPILSLLQHYGGLSPLQDWTLDFDTALFFGIERVKFREDGCELDNYFSVYIIIKDKITGKNESLINFNDIYKNKTPPQFRELSKNKLVYISDFNNNKQSMYSTTNYRILNQKGIFIFNNHESNPLDKYINKGQKITNHGSNVLDVINSIDIHKSLSKYIEKYLNKKKINRDFIYPDLKDLTSYSYNKYLESSI